MKNQDKISVKRPTAKKHNQNYAPRPSWRGTWEAKMPMRDIDAATRVVILGTLGLPKVT